MAKSITSPSNPIIKETSALAQKKYREKTGLFIMEGQKAIEEALMSKIDIQKIFSISENNFPENLPSCEKYLIPKEIMTKLATTDSPPNILAVAKISQPTLKEIKGDKILLLENIKDPGNLGTIIRTAVAMGICGILLAGDCVDIYNPKVIRSTTGNIFKIPIVKCDNFQEIKETFPAYKFIGTILNPEKNPKPLNEVDFKQPNIILFGSEASGLSIEAQKHIDEYLKIPLQNDVESLNLAISVGIVLYSQSQS